jgi:hypothetical protein
MKSFTDFVVEGGKAVAGVSRINQENSIPTVRDIEKTVLKALKLLPKDSATAGSTGKKAPGGSSGDIDLLVDSEKIIKNNNLKSADDLFPLVLNVAKKFSGSVKDLRGAGIISLAFPITNADGKQLNQKVQLDLMITDNISLLRDFTMWTPSFEESKWKGLYRTEMLMAIARAMNFKTIETAFDDAGKKVPVTFKTNFLDAREGLFSALQTRKGSRGNITKGKRTLDKKLISNSPIKIIHLLLGPKFKVSDAGTFESLFEIISSDIKFIHKGKKDEILKAVADQLTKQKFVVPKELKGYL